MYRIYIMTLLLFITCTAIAQKKKGKQSATQGTVAYYMLTDKQLAQSEKDANFVRLIIKADSGMFNIQDYYMDSKPRLIAYSSNGSLNFNIGLKGIYFEYYQNGKRKSVRRYNNGKLTGDDVEYFPNGQPYNVKNYDKDTTYYKECYDSTGTALAENGKGKWVGYSDDFKVITEDGQIKNGKPDGEWKIVNKEGLVAYYQFKNGLLVLKTNDIYDGQIISSFGVAPKFKGGDAAFGMFLSRSVRYPAEARENNIKGKVTLTFVVEKDGTIANVKIIKSVHRSIDAEALRTLKSSPLWIPGTINGVPVRTQYNVTIDFNFG
jgi:TonB family protein